MTSSPTVCPSRRCRACRRATRHAPGSRALGDPTSRDAGPRLRAYLRGGLHGRRGLDDGSRRIPQRRTTGPAARAEETTGCAHAPRARRAVCKRDSCRGPGIQGELQGCADNGPEKPCKIQASPPPPPPSPPPPVLWDVEQSVHSRSHTAREREMRRTTATNPAVARPAA